ncbi:arginine/ornithine antiporter [Escherichia coli]|uniref:Arginine/ornithine antiporter n=1 Tax=Escherichia coli TaxID=562 RepID=A0A377CJK4_ECOLX|nr:arginine/ornithine antiporter [Escherichia coli]
MEKKLGLSALTALVLSSMLGAGVFSLPQNMAAVASPAALLIGWGITGAGILLLAFAMLILTRIRPNLTRYLYLCPRRVWRANRLLFRMGILAVRSHRQRLLSGDRFFRVKLFYGHAGIAPVRRW